MKTLKKIIPLLVLSGTMFSCSSYSAKPGKLENLVGTYELDIYKMKHNDEDSEEEPYDRKAEIGAVAYFSIDSEGYGYYAYKDNSTSPKVSQVFSHFSYDKDNPELIESINQTDGVTHKYANEQFVGCLDEAPMGFRDELLKKTLSYTLHSGHMIGAPDKKIRYQHVVYKRVDKEASLKKVNNLMGTNTTFQYPFELKQSSGYYVYRCQPKEGSEIDAKNIYEYAILDMTSFENGKAKLYYSLKEEPGKKVSEISFSLVTKAEKYKATILGKEYFSEGFGLSFGTTYDAEQDITWESFSHHDYPTTMTLEELIEAEKAI